MLLGRLIEERELYVFWFFFIEIFLKFPVMRETHNLCMKDATAAGES